MPERRRWKDHSSGLCFSLVAQPTLPHKTDFAQKSKNERKSKSACTEVTNTMANAKNNTPTKKCTSSKHATPKSRSCSGNSGAHQKVLDTAAMLVMTTGENPLERQSLVQMIGTMGKSTLANAFTKLKKLGWMNVNAKSVEVTDLGMENADTDNVKIVTTNEEHQAQLKEKLKLKDREMELFDLLVDGEIHDAETIAKEMGMKMNSTWANLKTSLKKKGILDFQGKTLKLSDKMYPFGRPLKG